MITKYRLMFVSALMLTFSPSLIFAADTAARNKQMNDSPMVLLLAAMMIVFLIVIAGLGTIIKSLSSAIREKIREEGRTRMASVIAFFLIFSITALKSNAAEKVAAASATSDKISGMTPTDFYLMVGVITLELLVILWLVANINKLLRILTDKTEIIPATGKPIQRSWFWDTFNNAVPIEKEKDKLLDHNYDGIRELDNSLPPWWIYGFYVTIIFACIYLYRFSIAHIAPDSHEELAIEMQKADEDKAAYMAKHPVTIDENTVTLLKDEASLSAGKQVFVTACAPCHRPDGGGVVGPNLTDDYWLHGGSIKDIFKTIKYGYIDKGMKSWKDDYSPLQIQQIASYIKSIKGTNPPAPKAPQGDLYIEGNTATAPSTTANAAVAEPAKK